ncbi:hypothetical protein IQ07DRAFT_660378 [Pyrenochaeta sp. DS3sAY3a]|nr:hypothetical protein IQ07DRAFT_660378 [Pyrenochaeta sp. DS3sAY3a]
MSSKEEVDNLRAVIHQAIQDSHQVIAKDPIFHNTEWCAKMIGDPTWIAIESQSHDTTVPQQNTFLAKTLQTDSTIHGCLTLIKSPLEPAEPLLDGKSRPIADTTHGVAGDKMDTGDAIKEVVMLLSLGSAVNGFANMAHGGFVSTLLDEVIGVLNTTNIRFQEYVQKRKQPSPVTAYLNVTFQRPLPTPSIIQARAWYKGKDSTERKRVILGTLEDGQGVAYAKVEGLLVLPRQYSL